jgi:hypothetical protein
LLICTLGLISLWVGRAQLKRSRDAPLAIAALMLTLLSLSTTITLGPQVLLEISLPEWLMQSLGLLRSSGRLFWPVTYLSLLASMVAMSRLGRPRVFMAVLLVCVGLQAWDVWPYFRSRDLKSRAWTSQLRSPIWRDLAARHRHLVIVPRAPRPEILDSRGFLLLAGDEGATINLGYVARGPSPVAYAAGQERRLYNGVVDPDTLYVIAAWDVLGTIQRRQPSLEMGVLDGLFVFSSSEDVRALPGVWPLPRARSGL